MKVEEGKMYVRRDGGVAGPMELNTDERFGFSFRDPKTTRDYNESGRKYMAHEHYKDLIEEYKPKDKRMKVELGKRYVTQSGKITGPIKLNPNGAINYPYLDPNTCRVYEEDGVSQTGNSLDDIFGRYYELEEPATELPQVVDTVTISRKDYDRYVALEMAFEEIYSTAKRLR